MRNCDSNGTMNKMLFVMLYFREEKSFLNTEVSTNSLYWQFLLFHRPDGVPLSKKALKKQQKEAEKAAKKALHKKPNEGEVI